MPCYVFLRRCYAVFRLLHFIAIRRFSARDIVDDAALPFITLLLPHLFHYDAQRHLILPLLRYFERRRAEAKPLFIGHRYNKKHPQEYWATPRHCLRCFYYICYTLPLPPCRAMIWLQLCAYADATLFCHSTCRPTMPPPCLCCCRQLPRYFAYADATDFRR